MKKYASVSVITSVHPHSNYTLTNVNVFVIATVHQDLHLTRTYVIVNAMASVLRISSLITSNANVCYHKCLPYLTLDKK